MVETKDLNREVEDFIIKEFGLKPMEYDSDELSEAELIFECNDTDCEKVCDRLKEHFGFQFHTTSMGGIMAVLMEP